MSLCPNGHSSESTDYCDVCGAPMAAPASAAPATAATGSVSGGSAPLTCPNCSFPALPDALFCENCGYDFTTGSLPEPEESLGMTPSGATPAPVTPSPVTPSSATPTTASAATPAPAPLVEPEGAHPAPSAPADPGTTPTASPTPSPVVAAPAPAPDFTPAPAGEDAWVAEVWIDPEWYAAQKAEDPLPSGGLPGIVVLRQRSVLVGRHSASRGIVPQIDCGTDSGVSRRQCQLNTDGQRWWVEDLQSSNGTFLSPPGEELPTEPITPGQRHEVSDGDRIFIGAWTRLVIRKALPGEA